MKKIFLTLILSFAIIGCEAPAGDTNSDLPTVIDETELVAITDAMYEAMNSDNVEAMLDFYADEAMWSFPNGVNIEGKEAIGEMLKTTTAIWDIKREEGTNYIAMKATDTNEAGEEEEFKILLGWGGQTFSNDETSITVPYHQVLVFFGDDNKIGWNAGFYDRTKFVESYDEDPIK
tara:strand:- start:5167 stop:5694 length:528 start_codon:yes stop_codon:yes gene_type:complete